jgi:predicted RNase H-like HicB family nuclease
MQYLVVFEKAIDDTIWARVPDLEGCFCDETIEEASENVKEAFALYLEDLFEAGESAPHPVI